MCTTRVHSYIQEHYAAQEMATMSIPLWRRRSSEYLNTLRKCYKWHQPKKNLEPGDVLILREDGVPTNHWPLGRIQEVFPGEDGLVRAATVRTTKGTYKRPVVKMSPLFLCDDT